MQIRYTCYCSDFALYFKVNDLLSTPERISIMTTSHPTSFRLSVEARRMLGELESHLGLKRSAILEMLIRERHRAEGISGSATKKTRKKSKDGA